MPVKSVRTNGAVPNGNGKVGCANTDMIIGVFGRASAPTDEEIRGSVRDRVSAFGSDIDSAQNCRIDVERFKAFTY